MTLELPRTVGGRAAFPGLPGAGIPFIGAFETTYLPEHDLDVQEITRAGVGWSADLDALAAAGVRQARYAVRWHRVEEQANRFDWTQTDRELAAMRARGVAPILDLLHHTSLPRWLRDGLRDPSFPPAFLRFVEEVAIRYPWAEAYTVVNEPTATLMLAGHEGIWPPYDRGVPGFTRLALNVLPAMVAAACRLRALLPGARHIWVDTCEDHRGAAGGSAEYASLANDRRHALLDLVLGHDLDPERPFLARLRESGGEALFDLPRITVDVLGLDYYPHSEWWYDGGGGTAPSPHPRGFATLATHYGRRYGLPVLVSETNIRGLPTDRVTWLRYMLEECDRVVAAGVPVTGFCWFPYVDSSDWDSLLARAEGRLDPVGVVSPRPDGGRERSLFTDAWESVAAGARADALPAFRLQAPCDTQLAPFLFDRDWSWVDPADDTPAIGVAAPVPHRDPDLVVFSHLRWDWVWQRPQHLVSRFSVDRAAGGARTWFVEEPETADIPVPYLTQETVESGVIRARVFVPGAPAGQRLGFEEVDAGLVATLVRAALGSDTEADVLLYTPLAADTAGRLAPRLTLYDVMDDLAGFDGAASGMRARQDETLRRADVVFAGGRSLHALAVGSGRPDAHLFPSGVDVGHYVRARDGREPRVGRRPVAGYVGVIDERLDLELVARLAEELPDWTIRMVGPIAKIAPESLPRAANIEYPGMATYADLPRVMAGFDVALMPFARNEATRSISPTKTLEYLAAGLPVVSTPLADVVADHEDVVAFAEDGVGFAAACLAVLEDELDPRDLLAAAALTRRDWGTIADEMSGLVRSAAGRRGARRPSLLGKDADEAHARAVQAATAGISDAALGAARLSGPGVELLAAAAVSSATPFLRAPLLGRLSEIARLHPARGGAAGACPTCGSPSPCPTAEALR